MHGVSLAAGARCRAPARVARRGERHTRGVRAELEEGRPLSKPQNHPQRYRTLTSAATAELEVKRSRFRCDLAPVSSEEAARAFVAEVRGAHRDARHHCTAYVLGPDSATSRTNDDGEPSGTAGAPMLDVLRGADLTDVAAVVTRWFGGTLLGTGGLIRAYGEAVALALDAATVLVRELREGIVVNVDLATGPRLEHALRGLPGTEVTAVEYRSDGVRLEVAAAPESREAVATTVAALTSGQGQLGAGPSSWVDA